VRLNLNQLRLDQLQEAIRSNQVSFPSQVPVFIKHAEGRQQCHVVLLYFVLGWSCDRIAKRYRFTRQHIWQIVSEWRRHAVALGYLQVIPPPEVLMPVRPPRLGFPSSVAFQSEAFQPEVFKPEVPSHEMVPHQVHVPVSVATDVAALA
jgi:hypothetical protein